MIGDLNYSKTKEHFDEEISAIACCKVKHEEFCHDILPDVYLKILFTAPKIEGAIKSARTWLVPHIISLLNIIEAVVEKCPIESSVKRKK